MTYKDPEKLREYHREYCLKHKEKRKEYRRKWREDNPDKNQKSIFMSRWKRRGLVGDLEAIYERWLNTTDCDVCKVSLEGSRKCMDHDHQSGEFRHILCWRCNTCDFWKKVDRQAIKNNF